MIQTSVSQAEVNLSAGILVVSRGSPGTLLLLAIELLALNLPIIGSRIISLAVDQQLEFLNIQASSRSPSPIVVLRGLRAAHSLSQQGLDVDPVLDLALLRRDKWYLGLCRHIVDLAGSSADDL